MKSKYLIVAVFFLAFSCTRHAPVRFESEQPVYPVLTMKEHNPVLKIQLIKTAPDDYVIEKIKLSPAGTAQPDQIESVSLFIGGKKGSFVLENRFGQPALSSEEMIFKDQLHVETDTLTVWVSMKLKPSIDLTGRVNIICTGIETSLGAISVSGSVGEGLRTGVALRQHMQDSVHTCRIPGLATSRKGTLLAIYDVRRELSRDLQGDIDIGLSRSFDGGNTWQSMQIVMDRGKWGGLDEKFNGISDACILVDENSGNIFIAGTWMYGILDDKGKWIEGLNKSSKEWNHQWRSKGSQPGFGVKETSQFLITKSSDDGETWTELINLTEMCKKKEWWLWAPAPGNGITMDDGTLVIPTQGRDKEGKPFSGITWSKDGGKTWTTSNPAAETPKGTTECAVVQLSDGSLMLNMRDNRNRGDESEHNGRTVAVTSDLGKTWTEHPTSRNTLIEPTCMASLYKHRYTKNGEEKSILVFSNPNSKTSRDHITIKVSFDDGKTWPQEHWILLDEGKGRGYSCLTSVDEQHIGILYEGSQSDMIFQKIPLQELLK
jgi:sialidase-1